MTVKGKIMTAVGADIDNYVLVKGERVELPAGFGIEPVHGSNRHSALYHRDTLVRYFTEEPTAEEVRRAVSDYRGRTRADLL